MNGLRKRAAVLVAGVVLGAGGASANGVVASGAVNYSPIQKVMDDQAYNARYGVEDTLAYSQWSAALEVGWRWDFEHVSVIASVDSLLGNDMLVLPKFAVEKPVGEMVALALGLGAGYKSVSEKANDERNWGVTGSTTKTRYPLEKGDSAGFVMRLELAGKFFPLKNPFYLFGRAYADYMPSATRTLHFAHYAGTGTLKNPDREYDARHAAVQVGFSLGAGISWGRRHARAASVGSRDVEP